MRCPLVMFSQFTWFFLALQLEAFFSVNVLQFVFLSLKLDGLIRWSWVVSISFSVIIQYLIIIMTTTVFQLV